MDKIIQPSLSPININFDVCKYDRTALDKYSIYNGSYGTKDFPGSYFVPIYNSTATDPTTTITRFLVSFNIYDNHTKIEQWKLDFGDGEKFIGSYNDVSTTLTSDINNSEISISLTDASKFPYSGLVLINNDFVTSNFPEYVYYTRSGNTLTGVRGKGGSSASAHASGATVKLVTEIVHQYRYDGGNNINASLAASLTAVDTRGRRIASRKMVYPKSGS
jgi:hypothetical protein